jgi:serine/threonine protein kinase
MSWKEMNWWMRLPRHSNILLFDRVVVDELEGRMVGFTSSYMPGGNLGENRLRIFKLKWLQQLIKVVDDLNLEHGIAHQDIAPRNLLVDESTDSIMLFDFNFAARINCPSSPGESEGYREDRNDIKGVIFTTYEIITQDNSLRSMPHENQNLDNLGFKWVKHPEVKLDHPVTIYQHVLQEWQERRAGNLHPVHPGDVPRASNWPSRPKPPRKTISLKTAHNRANAHAHGLSSSFTVDEWSERRQDVLDRGDTVLNWEQPAQRLLGNWTQLLSSGEVINC